MILIFKVIRISPTRNDDVMDIALRLVFAFDIGFQRLAEEVENALSKRNVVDEVVLGRIRQTAHDVSHPRAKFRRVVRG